MYLIWNDSNHLLRKLNQKLSIHYYNNKGTRKVKNYHNFSNEEIYFTLQSNSTKYKKTFKCISLPNFFERNHILIPEIWSKTFSD